MKYSILVYETEAELSPAPTSAAGAYSAPTGHTPRPCRRRASWPAAPGSSRPRRHHGAPARRQAPGAGRAVRRHQGAARRLLRDRRARPRHRARVGRAAVPPAATGRRGAARSWRCASTLRRDPRRRASRRRAAARASYGRLLAYLAARTRDIAAAEDALATRSSRRSRTWPRDGVPDEARGVAARRGPPAAARRGAHAARAGAPRSPRCSRGGGRGHGAAATRHAFPDERLALLFVCAHPAIDGAMRTPLMLQTVLGLDAARIAARVRRPARDDGPAAGAGEDEDPRRGIRFECPSAHELPRAARPGPRRDLRRVRHAAGTT